MRKSFRGMVLGVIVLLCISYPKGTEGQLSIASVWKARAFEAVDNLSSLQKEVEKYPWESKEAAYLKCKIMIEFAYASHLSLEEIAHKKEAGFEIFHLVLSGGKEEGLFDIVYVYTNEGKHSLTRIDALPKNWHLTMIPQRSNVLALKSSGGRCTFGFDTSNPFLAGAIEP